MLRRGESGNCKAREAARQGSKHLQGLSAGSRAGACSIPKASIGRQQRRRQREPIHADSGVASDFGVLFQRGKEECHSPGISPAARSAWTRQTEKGGG